MMLSYNVSCTFDDATVADTWIQWLREEHLRDVCEAGALSAEVVRFDGDITRCEVRYRFASREAFEEYERDHAPRLREEGLKRFPLERGLHYARSAGEIVGTYPTASLRS